MTKLRQPIRETKIVMDALQAGRNPLPTYAKPGPPPCPPKGKTEMDTMQPPRPQPQMNYEIAPNPEPDWKALAIRYKMALEAIGVCYDVTQTKYIAEVALEDS